MTTEMTVEMHAVSNVSLVIQSGTWAAVHHIDIVFYTMAQNCNKTVQN